MGRGVSSCLGSSGPSTPQIASRARRAASLRMTGYILRIALAFVGRGSVEMADGYGQGIGGVGRLGNLIEIQEARHHLLDLMFFGAAVSDYRGLNGEVRGLGELET